MLSYDHRQAVLVANKKKRIKSRTVGTARNEDVVLQVRTGLFRH